MKKTKNNESVKITDKVKTFKDACVIEGIDVEKFNKSCEGLPPDEVAYKELKIIVKALVQDWKADFNNNSQTKYFPYFYCSGSGFSYFDYGCDLSFTNVGSRLCFPTAELAIYAGKQFTDHYKTFML